MISENTSIRWSGNYGTVFGEVKYSSDFVDLYGKSESTGHFFPILFEEKYKDKDIKLSGSNNGDKTVHIDDDKLLILRIENLDDSKKLIIKETESDKTISTIDFNNAALLDPTSIPSQEEDLGSANGDKKVSDLIDASTTISWSGSTGEIDGVIKYVKYGKPYTDGQESGHFFPIKFDKKYYDKQINIGGQNGVGGKNITPSEEDPYLVIRTENVTVNNRISATTTDSDKAEIFTLDFSNATLPAVRVMDQDEEVGYGDKKASDLMSKNVKIVWNGTKGKVTGTIKYVSKWSDLPKGATDHGHFFAMWIDERYKGKKFEFIKGNDKIGNKVDEATDDEMFWILRVDKTKKFTFKSDDNVIAELDFTGATLGG